MAQLKTVTTYLTVAAGAQSQTQNAQNPGAVSSPDTGKQQRVRHVLMTGVGALGHLQILKEGNVLQDLDGTMFNATHGPLPVDVTYDPGVNITINLVNGTAGTLTNIPVTLWYEV